jgi:programmed cell death protein 5
MEEEGGEEQDSRQTLYQQRMQQMQIELQKKELLRRMLSDAAYERMMNVRLSAPEKYERIVQSLAHLAQSGKVTGKFSDEQLYSLLARMSDRRETSIEFRRK